MTYENFNPYSYYLTETEMMNEYDRKNFQNNLMYFKEGPEKVIPAILTSDGRIHARMIEQSMEQLRDIVIENEEISTFFQKILQSPRLDDIPITTKVYDIGLIEKIRPQFLTQMVQTIGLTIDKYIKGNLSKGEVENLYMDAGYLLAIKKQMVKTKIPYDVSPKEMYRYEGSVIVEINREFINTTLLPFMRSSVQIVKDTEITVNNSVSVLNKAYEELGLYVDVLDKMLKADKIDLSTYRFLNKYIYKATRDVMTASSYLTFAVLKKISLVYANIRSYKELEGKILNYFPEGDSILHESSFDDVEEFNNVDNAKVVWEMLEGRPSTIVTMIDYAYNRIKSDISYAITTDGASETFTDHQIEEHTYEAPSYLNARKMVVDIASGLETLEATIKDPNIVFDEALAKAGFDLPLTKRFATILADITTPNEYLNAEQTMSELEDKKEVLFTGLNELKYASEEITNLSESVRRTYQIFKDLKNRTEVADPVEFSNGGNLDLLRVFLNTFDADYKQYINLLSDAFIKRNRSLADILYDLSDEIYQNPHVGNLLDESTDDVNFEDLALEAVAAINDELVAYEFENYLREYHAERTFFETGMKVVYEADLATSANATNNPNQTPAQQDAEKAKPDKQGFKDRIDKLIQIVRNFFNKSKDGLNNIIQKQSGNLTMLQQNKDALVNRSFKGVTVNVVPYEKYVTQEEITRDINSLQQKITGLSKANIANYTDQKKLNAYLFSFMQNGMGNVTNINDTMRTYYKTKNAKLEVMPYKGAEAKTLMPVMVDYCIAYYSGFSTSITQALDGLQKALESKLNEFETVTESAMFEAEGDAQPAENKPEEKANTKPSVVQAKDAKTDSKVVKGGTNDGTYNILKWVSYSVQYYSAGVLSSTRDRNFEYLKIINGLMPKNANTDTQAAPADNAQTTEAQPTQA